MTKNQDVWIHHEEDYPAMDFDNLNDGPVILTRPEGLRGKFEDWYREAFWALGGILEVGSDQDGYGSEVLAWNVHGGEYQEYTTQLMWEAFQAGCKV